MRPATADDVGDVTRVHLESRRAAMPAMPPLVHPQDEVEEHLAEQVAAGGVWVAEHDGAVVAYLDLADGWLDSLYVHPSHARRGIGGTLIDLAKSLAPDGFGLWVFQSNEPAMRFYARHGFVEVERTDGGDNEERAPDVRMVWPAPARRSAGGWERVPVGDLGLEVAERGSGAPVVVVQTALTAGELLGLGERTAEAGGFRVVHCYRRGYAGSARAPGPVTIEDEAEDCRALIETLGIAPAHVVGASYSAAVALTLASKAPHCVRTVTVLEPPPVHVPSAADFRRVCAGLARVFEDRGPGAALDELMTTIAGSEWRAEYERYLPGSVAAMGRDATTFFGADLSALLTWRFTATDAARILCPVLYVGGDASGPWFAEVRRWVRELLPRTEEHTVRGAGHDLALSHPGDVSGLIVDFLHRHQ